MGFLLAMVMEMPHSAVAEPTPSQAFQSANALYEQGQYADAASAYEKVMKAEGFSPELLFNWGNALHQSGRTGEAILRWRQAAWLAPGDPDIQANLVFSRQSAGLPLPPPPAWQVAWASWLQPTGWAVLALLGGVGFLTTQVVYPSASRRRIFVILTLLMSALGALGALTWKKVANTEQAVILVENTPARYGPLKDSDVQETLPSGLEVRVEDELENWVKVRDIRGKGGWVLSENVGRILPISPGD